MAVCSRSSADLLLSSTTVSLNLSVVCVCTAHSLSLSLSHSPTEVSGPDKAGQGGVGGVVIFQLP